MSAVRRLPLAVAVAFAAALPLAASAQTRHAAASSSGTQLGLLVGMEDGRGDTGLALRLDGEFPMQTLSPAVRMSFVGSIGYSHWSYSSGFFANESASLGIFKLTPALRFSFGQSATLRPYADAGIGVHYARFSVRTTDAFGRTFTDTATDTSLHLRFAGGILFQVSPAVALGAEIDLIPYFGDVDDNTFSLLFQASFRM
jgi:opacity protein-like surface antigen